MAELTRSLLVKCLGDQYRRGVLRYVPKLEYQVYNYMMEGQIRRKVI